MEVTSNSPEKEENKTNEDTTDEKDKKEENKINEDTTNEKNIKIENKNELIFEKLSKKINLNPNHNKTFNTIKFNTSYKVCHKETFNIDTLIFYLSTRDSPGMVDDLINLLYKNFQNDSLFYIPQLCSFLTYKEYTKPIENYLLDSCVDRMKFSLTTFWMTFANQASAKMEELQQNIETTLVNNRRFSMKINNYRINSKDKNILNIETDLIKESRIKEYKLKYFDYVFKFYDKLKKLCDLLKDTDKSERDGVLRKYLLGYNKKIHETKETEKKMPQYGMILNYFYEGLLLPFDDDKDTSDKNCNVIIRFIPEKSMCYHSKARVPILLTVECVQVGEIQEKEKDKEKIISFDSISSFLSHCDSIGIREGSATNNKSKNVEKDEIKNNHDFHIVNKDDISKKEYYFGKKYKNLIREYKNKSKYSNYKTYSLKSFIFKSNDDLRQELLALQLIKKFKLILEDAGIRSNLLPYEILITSKNSGMMEFLQNTISIDQMKKKYPKKNLNSFFHEVFEDNFEEAQKNFADSLMSYSLLCYFLEIRDRHNGNILIDINGNLIHIDFGFILGIGPGGSTFEQAPFKLTEEYVEVMDGIDSDIFKYFKSMLFVGFEEVRKHFETLWQIIEITYRGNRDLPCFKDRDLKEIKEFFYNKFKFDQPEIDLFSFVNPLIKESYDNGRTNQYDTFQSLTNGIAN